MAKKAPKEWKNMKLQDHPKIYAWPPSPGGVYKGAQPLASAGQGTLKDVEVIKNSGRPPHNPDYLSLTIEFQGHNFDGTLPPNGDHPDFIAQLYDLLKAHCIGMSIQDIGNVDIPF